MRDRLLGKVFSQKKIKKTKNLNEKDENESEIDNIGD